MQDWLQLYKMIVTFDKLFGRSKISDDNRMSMLVNKYILRFDISMSNGEHVEIVECSEKLIGVYFDES